MRHLIQPSLFGTRAGHLAAGAAAVRGLVRPTDPPPAQAAAAAMVPQRLTLQQQVLAAVTASGPMHDEALEQLPAFAAYAPSTIRKRRSELAQHGVLVAVGERRNSRGRRMTLWDLATRAYR